MKWNGKNVKNFVINRGKWLTADIQMTYGLDSQLRDEGSGLCCCLGIYLKSCGISDHRLNGKCLPSNVPSARKLTWLYTGAKDDGFDTYVQNIIADANDSCELRPRQREQQIARLFRMFGNIRVRFSGRYADASKRARVRRHFTE